MSILAAAVPNDVITEAQMEGLNIPPDVAEAGKGLWTWLTAGIVSIVLGIPMGLSWWRKHVAEGTDTGARIQSIGELQAILLAEREDRKAEREHFQAIEAALRQEILSLRERADKFAAERNDWMMKWSEVSGELQAVRRELESMRKEMRQLRGQNHADPEN